MANKHKSDLIDLFVSISDEEYAARATMTQEDRLAVLEEARQDREAVEREAPRPVVSASVRFR